jgi:hypothetical protein
MRPFVLVGQRETSPTVAGSSHQLQRDPEVRSHGLLERVLTSDDGAALVFGRTPEHPFTTTHVRKQALKAWAAENERRLEHAKENDLPKPQLLEPITLHEARHTYVSLSHAGICWCATGAQQVVEERF